MILAIVIVLAIVIMMSLVWKVSDTVERLEDDLVDIEILYTKSMQTLEKYHDQLEHEQADRDG